ncbi:MAG: VIT domain-containing protein [Acidobacteriota bacterium]
MASPSEVDDRTEELSSPDAAERLRVEGDSDEIRSGFLQRSDELSRQFCISKEPIAEASVNAGGLPSRLSSQVQRSKQGSVVRTPPSQKMANMLPQEFILWLGVILPMSVITLSLLIPPSELGVDPLPSHWHLLCVCLVPASNFLIWRRQWYGRLRSPRWLAHLNSLAIGVSLIYTLKYLHLVLMGLVLAFFLIGLWAMAPALALLCCLACRGYLHGTRMESGGNRLPGLSFGLTLALLLLGWPFLPALATEYGLHLAGSESRGRRQQGLNWLRRFGSHDELLRSCHRESDPAIGWLGAALANERPVSAAEAKRVYYRVTGQPLWSQRSTDSAWPLRRSPRAVSDPDLGGTRVGPMVEGLWLRTSRMETTIDREAMLANIEWTLVMRNESWRTGEGRAQIGLPPGGVISRVSLWVNGKERKGIVGEADKARRAYTDVVRQRRDPILVTLSGRDRALVQCFPISPEGGEMKFRLTIAAPLQLDSATQGYLRLPYLAERNFDFTDHKVHFIRVMMKGEGGVTSGALVPQDGGSSTPTWQGVLTNSELSSTQGIVSILREAKIGPVWSRNPFEKHRVVYQSLEQRATLRPERIILVLDTSASMSASVAEVADSLEALPPGVETGMLLVSDAGAELLAPIQPLTPQRRTMLADRIKLMQCEGGRSNIPALLQAWDLAAASDAGMVVWIHGPIPETTDAPEPFLEHCREVGKKPRVLDIQTDPGPNRLLEHLDNTQNPESVTRRGSLSQDLRQIFLAFRHGAMESILVRRSGIHPPNDASPASATAAWPMTCLWARDRIAGLLGADVPDHDTALTLAKQYHLVSPVSGAVVLETDEQYLQAGLTGVPPTEVGPQAMREQAPVSFSRPSGNKASERYVGSQKSTALSTGGRLAKGGRVSSGSSPSGLFSDPLMIPLEAMSPRLNSEATSAEGQGLIGSTRLGGGEIDFDLRSAWSQSGTSHDGLIFLPVTLFLVARLWLGGPMIRIPFEQVKK